jgi:hypothetical protein
MPKRTTRTSDRTRLLKSWLRANFDRCVADHIPMREAAAEATAALSFFVSASYMRHCSHLLRYRWPRNPRPHRKGNPGPRAHRPSPLDGTPLETNPTAALIGRPGKRLTAAALDDLRYMANHMLDYAAAIEFIVNNGHPPLRNITVPTPAECALLGHQAIAANPDHRENSPTENLTDTLCNLMHWAHNHTPPVPFDDALRIARGHFNTESTGASADE